MKRRTWAQRAIARERAMVQWALSYPRLPLPFDRRAVLWLGARFMVARLAIQRGLGR